LTPMVARQRKGKMPAYKRGREFKVILPPEISEWIENQALREGKPQSRIIIDHLNRIPFLEAQAKFNKLVNAMESILARYGTRVVLADLKTDLLAALDLVLAAKSDGELQARVEKLRILRLYMLRYKQQSEKGIYIDGFGVADTSEEAVGAAERRAESITKPKPKRAVRRSAVGPGAARTRKK
jgi:hypothetical protein